MANVKTGGLMAAKPNTNSVSKPASPIAAMIKAASVQERFDKMLGENSASFLSSLLTLVNNNNLLMKADPNTVLAAAATAASLHLPINPNLGQAWIVPYGNKATFIIGTHGLVQMMLRTDKCAKCGVYSVYEGEIRDFNRFTESYTPGEKLSDKVVGYLGYLELKNGFKKTVYWTRDEVLAHAKRFSKSFGNGPWQTDFDKMAQNTVLKNMLKAWAPLSIEMQQALSNDDEVKTMNEEGGIETVDTEVAEENIREVDIETGEIIS